MEVFLIFHLRTPKSLNDIGKTCFSGVFFQICEVLLTSVQTAYCHEYLIHSTPILYYRAWPQQVPQWNQAVTWMQPAWRFWFSHFAELSVQLVLKINRKVRLKTVIKYLGHGLQEHMWLRYWLQSPCSAFAFYGTTRILSSSTISALILIKTSEST